MSTANICSILFSLIMPPSAHLVTKTKPLNMGSSFLSIAPFIISELICYLHDEDVSCSASGFLSWAWLCNSCLHLIICLNSTIRTIRNWIVRPFVWRMLKSTSVKTFMFLGYAEKNKEKIKFTTFELCAMACRSVDGVCAGFKNSFGWSIMMCWNIFNSSYTSCPLTWSESWLFWNSYLLWKEECGKKCSQSSNMCEKELTLSYFGCSLWQHLEDWVVFTSVLS